MDGRCFCVHDEPYCVWGSHDSNEAFLRGIDTQYFLYLGSTHSAHLGGEHHERAVVALNSAYYHALETFFMLLYAALQASNCVSAWLLKCWPHHLRTLVDDTLAGRAPMGCSWKLKDGSWESVSNLIHRPYFSNSPEDTELKKQFAGLWRRFAQDYRQPFREKEYNSFKHGFRMKVGKGPTISLETAPPAEKQDSQTPSTISFASDFGSTYYEPEVIQSSTPTEMKHHFQLRLCQAHIDINQVSKDILMLGISINNVVAFLKWVNKFPPEECRVLKPDQKEAFAPPQIKTDRLLFVTLCSDIKESHVQKLTKAEILSRLKEPRTDIGGQ